VIASLRLCGLSSRWLNLATQIKEKTTFFTKVTEPSKFRGYGRVRAANYEFLIVLTAYYGPDIANILKRIIVTMPFTIYQLLNLIFNGLSHVMWKFDTKNYFRYRHRQKLLMLPNDAEYSGSAISKIVNQ
jgi:hypothetical protein